MSASKDPTRLLDYGDRLEGVLRGALDAERADDAVDAARLARIGRRVAEATAAAPPPSPAPAKPAALATKGPIVGIAAATLAGLVAVAVIASQSRSTPPPAAPAPIVQPAAPAPEEAPAPPKKTEGVPTVSPADLPSAPERPAAKAPPGAKAAAAPSEADEIALLGRAHEALRTSPAEALSLCKEHEAKYAGGHFAQEREAVAIEALVYLHRMDEARRRFGDFERRWPASSHRVHLESLLPR